MPHRPNVVIIMTDQQRADLSRREESPLDTTPFVDSLPGVWFDKAYTTMPVCAPARVSMLTGRYPSAHRVRTNHNIEDAYFTDDLFDVFHKAGYSTALIGKNHSHLTSAKTDFWYECGHLGIDWADRTPEEKAFDDWLKTTHFHMAKEAAPFPIECQIPYRLVSKAHEWIESQEKPFLLWLSFPEPHNPYQAPEPYYSMFPPESLPSPVAGAEALETKGFKFQWCRDSFKRAFPDYEETIPRARANYLGMLRLLDDQIRRFVEGLPKDTIIVILSDHGDFVGEYGLLRKGPEVPEALVRIPLQFAGSGIKPRKSNAHVSIADVMPTLCEAVGIPLPDGVQGRSLWPMLTGGDETGFESAYVEQGFGGKHYAGEEDLDPTKDGLTLPSDQSDTSDKSDWGTLDCLNSWTQSGTIRMVRKGNWKLVFDMDGRGQLYDLTSDLSELANLYDEPELIEKRSELLAELLRWRLRVEDPLPLPRKRYVFKR
ncbi:MAG TPA: sulfatase-like hydrolase/transferase [Armatimonadota bacterium]|nr:sulfatase-like hydrolase/transferase [Armatimonadota bacterium]